MNLKKIFTKFYNYLFVEQKKPALVLVIIFILFAYEKGSVTASIIQNISNYFQSPFDYVVLDSNYSFFKSKHGEPLFSEEIENFQRHVFKIQNCIVTLVVTHDTIVFYSIIFLDLKFFASLPYVPPNYDYKIGQFSFEMFSETATPLEGIFDQSGYTYSEQSYFGRQGKYYQYYLGYYYRNVVDFNENIDTTKFIFVNPITRKIDSSNTLDEWKNFRKNIKPNVFGVGSDVVLDSLIKSVGIIPDSETIDKILDI